ncbi:MAG: hypothetical protein KIS67_07465 [Verrucomicrobiae bacterium]|nr:hypothetical protein [Verrucomicrobiae bacterium]
MKRKIRNHTRQLVLLAALLGALSLPHVHAQFTFNSGSTGGYGPMHITTNTTLDLPPDGIFHCTTITVASNATLKFTPNTLNTPVYLLAQGDVVIDGTIDVSGQAGTASSGGAGGPGGFAGGNPGTGGFPASDGHGPGAGRAGTGLAAGSRVGTGGYGGVGSLYEIGTNHGSTYGSPLLVPLTGGSGGGGRHDGYAGLGGGGAILLASNTRIHVSGVIVSSGSIRDISACGYGSGGAIRLVSPSVSGGGSLDARGGSWTGSPTIYYGGAGRIRIDCMDRRALALNLVPSSVATIGANMVVFPPNAPRLDISQVGTNSIPVPATAPAFFLLPQGSPTNQTVRVQASNFGAVVPIRVVLTPDNGPSRSYEAEIDNTTINPAEVTVPVVVPVNVQVHVNAWTR